MGETFKVGDRVTVIDGAGPRFTSVVASVDGFIELASGSHWRTDGSHQWIDNYRLEHWKPEHDEQIGLEKVREDLVESFNDAAPNFTAQDIADIRAVLDRVAERGKAAQANQP